MRELLAINGIGPHKAKEYGQVFLDALAAEPTQGSSGMQPDPLSQIRTILPSATNPD